MIIYLVVNLVNGKRYVGQTRIGLEKRWRQHLRDATNGSLLPLHRAIRKHGQKEFITIPLELYLDYDRLNSQ